MLLLRAGCTATCIKCTPVNWQVLLTHNLVCSLLLQNSSCELWGIYILPVTQLLCKAEILLEVTPAPPSQLPGWQQKSGILQPATLSGRCHRVMSLTGSTVSSKLSWHVREQEDSAPCQGSFLDSLPFSGEFQLMNPVPCFQEDMTILWKGKFKEYRVHIWYREQSLVVWSLKPCEQAVLSVDKSTGKHFLWNYSSC